MNAAQQMQLAAALADALERSGIVVERAVFARGNVRGWERVDAGALAARTVGAWISWGFSASVALTPGPPTPAPTSTDPQQRPLRLVTEADRLNNDDDDDGA